MQLHGTHLHFKGVVNTEVHIVYLNYNVSNTNLHMN